MMHLSHAALAAALMIASAPAWAGTAAKAPDQGQSATPVQMVRTLQFMQDQVAEGSTEAHAGQRGLLGIFNERFLSLPVETWRDSKSTRAAVMFVLSGGNPQILRGIVASGALLGEDRPFAEGALAYVEGREVDARKALLPVDARQLPPMLGAQVALVQSALVVGKDPAKSMELLDFVRLQAPGTLLEEAALRREVFVASQIEDAEKFEFLVLQYLRRYRHSIYAGNFRQRLASALTRIDFGADPARVERIGAVLGNLEPDVRRDLYLLVAKSAVEQGKIKSVLVAAEQAIRLSEDDKVSATRAKLYHAAAMIVMPGALEAGIEDLKSLDRSILPAADIAVLNAALAAANQIRIVPDKPVAAKPVKTAPARISEATQASEQLPALSRAQEALNRVDKLIKN